MKFQLKSTIAAFPETMWAGTEDSLATALSALEMMHAAAAGQISAGVIGRSNQQDQEQPEAPYNYSLQGSVGVVSIRGSLMNTSSPFARYFGVTPYSAIREAMIYAANDPEAKSILMDIDSGGGAVSGVTETANLIAMIDRAFKPVSSYSGGVMASAAYWLGVSGSAVYSADTSVLGSIGILSVHAERSQQLKDNGINVTVMRSGQYKALTNEYEPLTKEAKVQNETRLDAAYGVFMGWVADKRHTSYATADANMGQGREFFGKQAVQAGLSDGIETFDTVVAKLHAKTLDTNNQYQNNSGSFQRGTQMKQALTDPALIAAQAGINLQAEGGTQTVQQTAPAGAPSVSAQVDKPEEKKESDTELVASLKADLRDAQMQTAKAQVALESAQTQLASINELTKSLGAIVANSISAMKVGLGFSAQDLSSMSAQSLIDEHAATAATFIKKFPVGGVAATPVQQAAADTKQEVPAWAGTVGATRVKK
jgi:signal peptide peptidase SppA